MTTCFSIEREIDGVWYTFLVGTRKSYGAFDASAQRLAVGHKTPEDFCAVYDRYNNASPISSYAVELKKSLYNLMRASMIISLEIDVQSLDGKDLDLYCRVLRFATEEPMDWESYLSFNLEEMRNRFKTLRKEHDKRQLSSEDKNSGYVYVIHSSLGQHKIGFTKDPHKRMASFIRGFTAKMPVELTMIHTIKTDDMRRLESELHTRFQSKRNKGEWFDLTDDDLAYLKSLTEINFNAVWIEE